MADMCSLQNANCSALQAVEAHGSDHEDITAADSQNLMSDKQRVLTR